MGIIIKSNVKKVTELSVSEEFLNEFEKQVEDMVKKAEEKELEEILGGPCLLEIYNMGLKITRRRRKKFPLIGALVLLVGIVWVLLWAGKIASFPWISAILILVGVALIFNRFL